MRKMNFTAVALTLALGAFGLGTAFADNGYTGSGSSGSVNATPQSTPIDNGTLNQSGTDSSTGTVNDSTGIQNQSGRDTSMATSNPCSQFNGIQNQSGTDTSATTSSASAAAGQNFQAFTVDKVTSHKIVLRPFNSGSSSSNVQLQSGREVIIPLHKFQTLVNQNGTSGGGSMSGTGSSSSTGSTGYGTTGSATGSTGTASGTATGSTGSSKYGASASTSGSASITPKVGDTVCVAMGTSNQPKAIQLLNGSSGLNGTQNPSGTDQGTMNDTPSSGTNSGYGATPAPSPATPNQGGSTP